MTGPRLTAKIAIMTVLATAVPSSPVRAAAVCTAINRTPPTLGRQAQARIESLIRQMVDRKIAPGAVLMIERRGKTVVSYVHGLADAERREPMTSESLFRIYSMTKPLTALAALQLVDQGKLRLDDPISLYIPEMAKLVAWRGTPDAAATEPLDRPVTVRDLLTHSAGFGYQGDAAHPVLRLYGSKGIGAGPGVGGVPTDGSAPARTLAEFTQKLATLPVLHQPGVRFSYGNASDVLGRVVEVASGRPLAEQMRQAVLKPLGMSSTDFRIPSGREATLTSAYLAKSQGKSDAGVFETLSVDDLREGKLTRIDDGK